MTDSKMKIAILMGGVSLEHEVSLRSGAGVVDALNAIGHTVVPITLLKNGQWKVKNNAPATIHSALQQFVSENVRCVFLALHGPNGEDGRIQGLLDCLDIPYTGSGCAASALAIDKIRAKAVVTAAGVRTAPYFTVSHSSWNSDPTAVLHRVMDELGLPVVLKAPCQGSSCGMAIPHNEHDFIRDMNEIMPLEDIVMVESYIRGLEVTCSILDTWDAKEIRPLPVTEIRPNESAYFDYYSKYTEGATREITPAHIGDLLTHKVQEAAVSAHLALGCVGWSRSDFILDTEGPVWLEVNTLPGLTETSLFPQAAAAVGISYNELIEILVQDAVYRHQARQHIG